MILAITKRIRREERLTRALKPIVDGYRNILIDCPPVLGILAYNAFVAADLLLVPIQPRCGCDQWPRRTPRSRTRSARGRKCGLSHFFTMFSVRTTRTNALVDDLLNEHSRRLLKTVIAKSESLNQANLSSVPITRFANTSRGADEYRQLCDDLTSLRLR